MSFFSLNVLQKGWLLAIITMVLWAVPVAMSFPSSSMTVRSATRTHGVSQTQMPGMNLSEVSTTNPFLETSHLIMNLYTM